MAVFIQDIIHTTHGAGQEVRKALFIFKRPIFKTLAVVHAKLQYKPLMSHGKMQTFMGHNPHTKIFFIQEAKRKKSIIAPAF